MQDDFDTSTFDTLDIPDGDIDYQSPSEDDDCEGGACKI